jgi:hypothetical protein
MVECDESARVGAVTDVGDRDSTPDTSGNDEDSILGTVIEDTDPALVIGFEGTTSEARDDCITELDFGCPSKLVTVTGKTTDGD